MILFLFIITIIIFRFLFCYFSIIMTIHILSLFYVIVDVF